MLWSIFNELQSQLFPCGLNIVLWGGGVGVRAVRLQKIIHKAPVSLYASPPSGKMTFVVTKIGLMVLVAAAVDVEVYLGISKLHNSSIIMSCISFF